VDFVLYGERGLMAFEVKMTSVARAEDLRGLRRFREDHPAAKAFFVYTGPRRRHDAGIEIVPAADALVRLGAHRIARVAFTAGWRQP